MASKTVKSSINEVRIAQKKMARMERSDMWKSDA